MKQERKPLHDLLKGLQVGTTVEGERNDFFLADQVFHHVDHRIREQGDQDGIDRKGADCFTGVHLFIFHFSH